MSTIILGEPTRIEDLRDLRRFIDEQIEKGMHQRSPVSVDGDHAMFSGGVYVRVNHNEGADDEQYLDIFFDDGER